MRQLLRFAIGGFGTDQTRFDVIRWFLNHVPLITRAVVGAFVLLAVATVTVGVV